MFVSNVNNVKIYNLSAGKSLPEWLSEKKRKSFLKKNVDVQRRIELIQDFDMPAVSTAIKISKDGQYIFATGTYKPRVKCFDVTQMSLKFERCFDSEPVTFEILSDDYSKLVFLHCDRYVEFHAAHGRYYRLRIPKFGRDMSYHTASCDLFLVGHGHEIFRLNLERGQFLQPFETSSHCLNVVEINPEHQLVCTGTEESTVEVWDPRACINVGTLCVSSSLQSNVTSAITAVKFKNGLQMAVGTESGLVVLYDIRSTKPLLVKDHLNKLPVKKIDFNPSQNVVYSLDKSMLKIWDENTGKQKAYIDSSTDLNDFCTVPNTGMFFLAQEGVKMLSYYIPSLGCAPRWCSFLDNLTEEIESESVQNIYDDYKFVTKQELEELGLEHLQSTNLLKAYMHGFFIDLRLYNKAKAAIDPFTFEKYKREKVRSVIEASRPSRIQVKSNVPKVNKDLVNNEKLLNDDRFREMFSNAEFAVDKNAEEYRLLAPIISHSKTKTVEIDNAADESDASSDEDLFYNKNVESSPESSDEDDKTWTQEVKKEYKKIKHEKMQDNIDMMEMNNEEFGFKNTRRKHDRYSLAERLSKVASSADLKLDGSNRQMTFSTKKPYQKEARRMEEIKKHREERRKVIRSTKKLSLKKFSNKK